MGRFAIILYSEGTSKLEEADAHKVLEILCDAYPGHPWATRVDGGIVFIRHLELGFNWGMVKKFKDLRHDATTFKKEIIMAAGEFLERAHLVRGRSNGDEIVHVDGLPDKFQPHGNTKHFEHIFINPDPNPLREELRPQVKKDFIKDVH